MTRRHERGMGSSDRLFPNHDTLPRGGFGNLIALPLQLAARRQGNTVFLDERFEPFADQWAFLASVRPIGRVSRRRGSLAGRRAAPEARPRRGWRSPARRSTPLRR